MTEQASNKNDNDKVEITTPPNDIKSKLGEGGIPSDGIKKAEKTLSESAAKFMDVAKEDLDIIADAIAQGKSGDKPGKQVIREINASAFELKSNAGMFDYPLVTDIATSLFQLTDMLEEVNEAVFDVLNLHYQSIRAAIAMGGKAENPEDTKALIKGLMAASSKILQKED